VVYLIRVHHLDEAFLKQLHPSVHRDFIECLEEKRRDTSPALDLESTDEPAIRVLWLR
jgi:hypothetical protein